MSSLTSNNAAATLQKLKQEEQVIMERIDCDRARLEVIKVQCVSLETLIAPAKTKPSSPK